MSDAVVRAYVHFAVYVYMEPTAQYLKRRCVNDFGHGIEQIRRLSVTEERAVFVQRDERHVIGLVLVPCKV